MQIVNLPTDFSQNYKVDERYRGIDNRSFRKSVPIDNFLGLSRVDRYMRSLRKARNFRRGASLDPQFPTEPTFISSRSL